MNETKELTIKRFVPVKLNAVRKQYLAEQQAHERMEELRNVEYLKRINDSIKEEIKQRQHRQSAYAKAIVDGFEMKEVACLEVIDLEARTIGYRPIDEPESEVLEKRPMTPEEVKHYQRKKEERRP